MHVSEFFRVAREFFVGAPSFGQAMQLGGLDADRALDRYERAFKESVREGEERALVSFELFYLTALERGSDESRKKFVRRIMPLLPHEDQQRATIRLGIDTEGNICPFYRELQRNLAVGGAQSSSALDRLESQYGPALRSGGQDSKSLFWDLNSLVKLSGNDETTVQYRRRFLQILPEADRAAVSAKLNTLIAEEMMTSMRSARQQSGNGKGPKMA